MDEGGRITQSVKVLSLLLGGSELWICIFVFFLVIVVRF